MAEQNVESTPNNFFEEITKLIEEMKVIKKDMEEHSEYQQAKLTKPQKKEDSEHDQLSPAQVMKLVQEEAKQQTRKVKEQIHKIHEHLKIQLGLVQKIEQLQQDLIPLKRKQEDKFKKLHDNLNKKAKKLKEQATSIQDECRKVHDKFKEADKIEKQAEGIKLDDIQDITLSEQADKEEMRRMINKQGEVIKAQLLAQEIQHKIQRIQHEATEVEQKAHRILWDEYYMKLACLTALRSKDPSTPVS